MGINYILKKTETKQHSTNLNLVYQNSTNQQEGETIEGGENSFYNGVAAYTLGYPERALNISLAANVSYNTIAADNNLTLGPTLSIGKQFFDKRLRTNFSSSYNTSFANGEQQNNVYNFRLGSNYAWLEKHNLSLNFLMLFRNSTLNTGRDLTITFGYSYAFDNFKLNLKRGRRLSSDEKEKGRVAKNRENTLRFRYRDISYSGTIPELSEQLTNVYQSSQFADIPQFKKDELSMLLAITKEQKKDEAYKKSALVFLAELYSFSDFQNSYNQALYAAIIRIKGDMRKIDMILENSFVETKVKLDKHALSKNPDDPNATEEQWTEYKRLVSEQEERLQKLVGHRWMENNFSRFNEIEDIKQSNGYLKEFKDVMSIKSYKLYDKTGDLDELELYLENEIIDYYYKKSLGIVNPDNFELKYINKN